MIFACTTLAIAEVSFDFCWARLTSMQWLDQLSGAGLDTTATSFGARAPVIPKPFAVDRTGCAIASYIVFQVGTRHTTECCVAHYSAAARAMTTAARL